MFKIIMDDLMKELQGKEGSFLHELHMKNSFDFFKYKKFLKNIKDIKTSGDYEYKNEFFFLVLDRASYLGFLYSDIRIGQHQLNISEDDFFNFYEEILYELKSLFQKDIGLDFHDNIYK